MFRFRIVERKEEDNRKAISNSLSYIGNNLLKLRLKDETFIIYCQGYKNITPRLISRLKEQIDLPDGLYIHKEEDYEDTDSFSKTHLNSLYGQIVMKLKDEEDDNDESKE